jgi:hypothetical protein
LHFREIDSKRRTRQRGSRGARELQARCWGGLGEKPKLFQGSHESATGRGENNKYSGDKTEIYVAMDRP